MYFEVCITKISQILAISSSEAHVLSLPAGYDTFRVKRNKRNEALPRGLNRLHELLTAFVTAIKKGNVACCHGVLNARKFKGVSQELEPK